MSEVTSIQKVRAAVVDVEQSGQKSVDIQALLNFLTSVESELPLDIEMMKLNHATKLAHDKALHDGALAQYKAEVDGQNEMFRSVIDTGKTALTTSILVNGGATVALLALIGNLLAKAVPGQAAILAPGLLSAVVSFAAGVLLGAVATGATYCTQYCYHHEHSKSATTFHIATFVFVVSTYVAFAIGVGLAYHGFIK